MRWRVLLVAIVAWLVGVGTGLAVDAAPSLLYTYRLEPFAQARPLINDQGWEALWAPSESSSMYYLRKLRWR